jgi:DNA-directed RNA polymerase subunit E'/Rpb7
MEAHVKLAVEFRLIVFRPFKGETLLGKISSATPDGINGMWLLLIAVTLGP